MDFQNFCTAGKRMKFATKLIRHYRLTLGTLLHYLGKLKIQISAEIQQSYRKFKGGNFFWDTV